MTKKIALFNTFDSGGAALAFLNLAQALNQENAHAQAVVLYQTKKEIPYLQDFRAEMNKFEHLVYKIKNKQTRIIQDKKAKQLPELFAFNKQVWRIHLHPAYKQADIIHFHWLTFFLDWKSFFKANKKPIIWTLHDFAPFSAGLHYPIDQALPDFFKKISQKQLIEKKALLKDQNIHFICPSKYLLTQIQHTDFFNEFPASHIHNLIDNQIFKPLDREQIRRELSISPDTFCLFFSADHLAYQRKGYHLLEQALTWLDQEKNQNLLLLIAGNGVGKKQFKNLKIRNLGYIHAKQTLAQLYNAADLFVCPSTNDNLPNTVLESHFCACPVLAYACGGLVEMVDEHTGLLAEQLSAESLYESLKKAINHTFKRSKIYEIATQKYNNENSFHQHLKLYEQIC